jgi:hypothetical protein
LIRNIPLGLNLEHGLLGSRNIYCLRAANTTTCHDAGATNDSTCWFLLFSQA